MAIATPEQIKQEEQQRLENYHYLFDMAMSSYVTCMTQGPRHVIPNFVEHTVVEVARDGIVKGFNLNKPYQHTLVGWGLDFLRAGYSFHSQLKAQGYKTKGWITRFIFKHFLPGFMRRMVVDLTYNAVVNTFNLDYPQFVKKNIWLQFFAMEVPGIARALLGGAYDMAYNYSANRIETGSG